MAQSATAPCCHGRRIEYRCCIPPVEYLMQSLNRRFQQSIDLIRPGHLQQ
jgi:hypothetical protein